MQESSFTGNDAANSQGGALSLSGSTCSLINSTLDSNTAARGAGIYIANSSLTVDNITFTSNAARSTGKTADPLFV